MKSLKKFFSFRIIVPVMLILLTIWSLTAQTYNLSPFDRAKKEPGRWPYYSNSHLVLAQALYQTGSLSAINELDLAKKSLYKNKTEIDKVEALVTQPEQINKQFSYWRSINERGIESPQVYLHLAVLSFEQYQNDKALEYWQKAIYLDPNSPLAATIGKIIQKK